MGHLAYGGEVLWGKPYDPEHTGAEALEQSLPRCPVPEHQISLEFWHNPGGYPEFDSWPRYSTIAHQQAYVDWVRRAYDGGLRLVCCSAVNNEVLAARFGWSNDPLPPDDRSTVDRQLEAMKEMVRFIDHQSGGRGKGWTEIAYSAEDARRIIESERLAVVLGMEVDSLGNWRTESDLPLDPAAARVEVRRELERLYESGVRQVTPIHLTDNAFGGAAVYNRMFDALNKAVSGSHYIVEDASPTGVAYRLEDDLGGSGIAELLRAFLYREETESDPSHSISGGHANEKGLTDHGRILIDELMRLGMVIDIDHMSQRAAAETLERAKALGYPLVATHAAFRELALPARETSDVHKVATEALQTAQTLEDIRALGGMVAPILNQGDVRSHGDRVDNDCTASSKSWAQAYLYAVEKMGGQGVALGSDVNGLAGLPGPRFGTHAASVLVGDDRRRDKRRDQIDAQKHGVRYDSPLADYRANRWDGDAEDGYAPEEALAFEAVALARSGEDLARADSSEHTPEDAEWIGHAATGLRAERLEDLPAPTDDPPDDGLDAARVQRGAFHARAGTDPADIPDAQTREVCLRIGPIWKTFEDMDGPNSPLSRSVAGRRDFDINVDGMAHYGLLRDFVQDLRNVGLTEADLEPLFRSAEDFVRMWGACEQAAAGLAAQP
jgi:microsomal dipeptidase-like Zn-dependent dipeptidase